MAEENHSHLLKKYFDSVIEKKFGHIIPPEAIITPFGVKTFDAILGGGIASSLLTAFSSAPETGKSTLAFQFAANFIKEHAKSVVVYIDIEGASSIKNQGYVQDRITTFGIDPDRITYIPSPLDLLGVFDLIKNVIAGKRELESRTNNQYKLLIIWDSIAATSSSKDINAEDPNEVIGYKARELTHYISRVKSDLIMNQVTLIVIDQIRANMKIQSRFQTPDDKGVGEFSTNFKAATNVSSFQHAVRQWVYFSRGTNLTVQDALGVDGFIINVVLEKNKLAPSKIKIPLVFDKKFGVIGPLSEYYFINEHTAFEKKVYKDAGLKKIFPPLVETSGRSKVINVIDSESGEILESSEKFNERHFLKLYYSDLNFKRIFDKAVDISINERIIQPFFNRSNLIDSLSDDD
jgi:RecA/RadA recombinase